MLAAAEGREEGLAYFSSGEEEESRGLPGLPIPWRGGRSPENASSCRERFPALRFVGVCFQYPWLQTPRPSQSHWLVGRPDLYSYRIFHTLKFSDYSLSVISLIPSFPVFSVNWKLGIKFDEIQRRCCICHTPSQQGTKKKKSHLNPWLPMHCIHPGMAPARPGLHNVGVSLCCQLVPCGMMFWLVVPCFPTKYCFLGQLVLLNWLLHF